MPSPLPPRTSNHEQTEASPKAKPQWQFHSQDTTEDTYLGQRGEATCVSASSCVRIYLLQ